MATAPAPPEVAQLDWPAFTRQFRWDQGEHVALIGPTGQGKSTLSHALLERRRHVVIVATKPEDRTTDALRSHGYQTLRTWPPRPEQRQRGSRFILWPRFRKMADQAQQAQTIGQALNQLFEDGSWCVCLDETEYVSEDLRLRGIVRLMLKQGRSLKLSVVTSNQRPVWLPRETLTQATHLFIWGTSDRDDLKALGGLGVANSETIRHTVARLPRFHCLYVNTRDGTLYVTQAPKE